MSTKRVFSTLKAFVHCKLVTKPSSSLAFSQNLKLSTKTDQATSSNYKSPYNNLFEMMRNDTSSPFERSQEEVPKLKCGISEGDIQFKTTSYGRLELPPYVHTNEYKVTLQVNIKLLPLENDTEREIFRQIVGRRFNEERNQLKLTSNQFASRIENKRHLCWMLDRIIIGAKRLAAENSD